MNFDFMNEYGNSELDECIDINNDIDMLNVPVAWSEICFNETINYYTNCNTKTINNSMELD